MALRVSWLLETGGGHIFRLVLRLPFRSWSLCNWSFWFDQWWKIRVGIFSILDWEFRRSLFKNEPQTKSKQSKLNAFLHFRQSVILLPPAVNLRYCAENLLTWFCFILCDRGALVVMKVASRQRRGSGFNALQFHRIMRIWIDCCQDTHKEKTFVKKNEVEHTQAYEGIKRGSWGAISPWWQCWSRIKS